MSTATNIVIWNVNFYGGGKTEQTCLYLLWLFDETLNNKTHKDKIQGIRSIIDILQLLSMRGSIIQWPMQTSSFKIH